MFSRLSNNIKVFLKHIPSLGGAWGGFEGTFVFFLFLFLLSSCAKMGEPDGGWYDEAPPKILGSAPADRSTDVNSKKITILFDEFIKLDNPTEKVVVSPPQLEAPIIKGQGKKISIELIDELKPNTTYTVDFSDAISDNNENNPLGNYTYSFSTGDHIDTMEVAGYVLEAENLEPIKGILVGLYSNQSDTAFQKLPMLRVSRTDSRGHFSVKGVAKGDYRIYALQDADGNYMFNQPSEKLAFTPEVIMPSSKPDIRQDTIWRDSLRIQDIRQTPYTHFLPDDVVLTAFTEVLTDRYFLKAERREADHFSLFFSYGHADLPTIKGLNFNADDAFIVEPSMNQDTITYWLRDTMLVNQDTLQMELQYMATDSLGSLVPQTDTLEVLSKNPYAKRMKQKQEEYAKWKKQQDKNKERGREYETEYPAELLDVRYNVASSIAPDENPTFDIPAPVAVCDTSKIHLYEKIDTLWYRAQYQFGADPSHPRRYKLVAGWNPGSTYSLELDSMAFVDVYGRPSKKFKQGIKVRALEEFSTLIFSLQGVDGKNCLLQLMNASDKPLKTVAAKDNAAIFYYVKPGKYYMRMIVDDNDNGRWDTGLYSGQRQAEAVYYYPKEIECQAKREFRDTWNPHSTPLYRQKPANITKQKGDAKQKQRSRNAERAKNLGLEYNPKNGIEEHLK
ncbi:Ig-like domain-containing protein [Prevotella sp. HUN102]|uniref:Ig-like domain-containing protein n=1 Tax=Prevotella sp. HUN102 TaxID=1392486 RepID=UPI0009DCA683|nr:Ig-like domain-containing protein [Prevotella sp. HUN102]